MTEPHTPTEARVCIDFCNAAIKRPGPDGSFMTMEEADAAFDRFADKMRADALPSVVFVLEGELARDEGHHDLLPLPLAFVSEAAAESWIESQRPLWGSYEVRPVLMHTKGEQ